MALDINNYETALQQGALIQAKNLASSSVTGAKLSTGKNFAVFAVPANAVAQNVFDVATAPVAGTVTGLFVVAGSTTAGTIALFGTTAGTIVQNLFVGTTVGLFTGTAVLNAAVAVGDTLTVTETAGTGSATVYITFKTAS